MRFWHTHWTDGWTPALLDATRLRKNGLKTSGCSFKNDRYIYIYTSYMSVDHVHPWVGVKSSEILQYYRFFHEFQQICAMVAWFAELNHAMSWTFMRLLFICWAMPKCQQGDPVVICRMFCSGLNGCSGFTRPCSYGSKVRPVGICWDHHPLDLLKRKPFSSRGFPSVWKLLH